MSETLNLDEFLRDWPERAENLIPVLQEIQAQFHYLPEPVLREAAQRLDVPLTEVFHVATFYNCFSLEPVGRHLVQICLGTACHVRGAPRVLDRLLRELNLGAPGTTRDYEFTVRTVRCVGCCGLAPVVRVNNTTHPHLTQTKVRSLLKKYGPEEKAPAAG
ncbi:MAG: NAD(P)H-dependent oxidoreductase subunit E [Terriglobia bacterium]